MSFFATLFLSGMLFLNANGNVIEPASNDINYEYVSPDKKSDLRDAIDDALNYIKKALNSSSLSDLQSYARKAKNSASEAEDLADDLNLDDVEYDCAKGYKYCRAAEGEDSMKDAIEYLQIARKALNSASSNLR